MSKGDSFASFDRGSAKGHTRVGGASSAIGNQYVRWGLGKHEWRSADCSRLVLRMDSTTRVLTVFVPLLNEGTPVVRPAKAV